MDITAKASVDANILENVCLTYVGLTSSVLPEVQTPNEEANTQTGVFIRNAHKQTKHWYALRTTYGREKKAHEFIIAHDGMAFLPTIVIEKVVNGKKELVEISRIPNILFAYGTEEDTKTFVYDNNNLLYLRFYYKHTHVGSRVDKIPMIVPDSQIKTLKIICDADASDNVLKLPEEVKKFKEGQRVQVNERDYKGMEGIVARYHGQQRVVLLLTDY